jgi:predicted ABC-type ATPase
MRRLDLIVGPNGAGKTTFVRYTLSKALPPGVVFVNADEIALQRWPGQAEEHAYDAAGIAERTRQALLTQGVSFMAETVFSHPSKLGLMEDARGNGYQVFLHGLLVPEELSVARVLARVEAGGHSVPEEKVRQRYQRLWPLVAHAIVRADAATVYDNSGDRPRIVGQYVAAQPVGRSGWPPWTPKALHPTR